MNDLISRQDAIDAVCMEWCGVKHQDCKHPLDAEKDDYYWCDGCETALRTLPGLPPIHPTLYGYDIAHLELIARVLQKENLPPEKVVEALTDIGRIVAIVEDEFGETLRKAVEQCMI